MLDHVPQARPLLQAGRLRAGTVDAWLLWNLTGGASFATDHSNASRTQLFDTRSLQFSPDLCALFGADMACLPAPMPLTPLRCDGRRCHGAAGGIPIRAMMGDSHAALYGHGIRAPGPVKATYGTGFIADDADARAHRIGPWPVGDHRLDGGRRDGPCAGRQHHRQCTGCRLHGAPSGPRRRRGADGAGRHGARFGRRCLCPRAGGPGAPHWDDAARGTVTGMTHATTPAHLARATLEAIAHQIADVWDAMEADIGHPLDQLSADGGASGNAVLMQLQADVLQRPVRVSAVEEVGALGAAAMAARTLGHPGWSSDAAGCFPPVCPCPAPAGARHCVRARAH